MPSLPDLLIPQLFAFLRSAVGTRVGRIIIGTVLLWTGVITACQDEPQTPDTITSPSSEQAVIVAEENSPAVGSFEQVFADVADRIPEFAGFWYGQSELIIAVTDESRGPAARNAMAEGRGAAYLTDRAGAPRQVSFQEVSFSFSDLATWRNRVMENMSRVRSHAPSVHELDLDEAMNAVRVGVADEGDVSGVHEALEEHGIPEGAQMVTVSPLGTVPMGKATPEFATYTDSTLHDNLRPVSGGQRIVRYDGNEVCTVGWTGENTGFFPWKGFITNSHCTEVLADTDTKDSLWYAAEIQPEYFIARDANDPEWEFEDGESKFSFCNLSGNACRWSDAAWQAFRTDDSLDFGWGKLWNTEGWRDIDIVASNPHLEIESVSRDNPPAAGETVYKLGQTTSETSGEVIKTCVHKDHPDAPENHFILCNHKADNMTVRGGDSGAAVYGKISGTDDVVLHGLLWWAEVLQDDNFTGVVMFNPVAEIENELDAMTIIPPS